jgi:hypothetical protein
LENNLFPNSSDPSPAAHNTTGTAFVPGWFPAKQAEGGNDLPDILAPATRATDPVFLRQLDQHSKLMPAITTPEVIDRHETLHLPLSARHLSVGCLIIVL